MKNFTVLALCLTAALAGCNQGTSGGPGATTPPKSSDVLGQAEDTFSLGLSATAVRQGETKELVVAISRGQNFSEDVTLKFAGLPEGVSVAPAMPAIKHSATESRVMLTAASNAALGDFTVKVSGHPAKGADAVTEMEISVNKANPEKAAEASAAAAEERLEAYVVTMDERRDQYEVQLDALEDRVAGAEGQAKSDLEAKHAAAQVRLDEVDDRIRELGDAEPEKVESIKVAMNGAFAALKTALE